MPPRIGSIAQAKARAYVTQYTEEVFLATTGVSTSVFCEFYGKYAAVCTPGALRRALIYLKLATPKRAFTSTVGLPQGKDTGRTTSRAKDVIDRLAAVVSEIDITDLESKDNVLPGGQFPNARGIVDSVPWYVEAKSSPFSTALYSGKSKDTCAKFEVIVDLRGVPVYFRGPFPVFDCCLGWCLRWASRGVDTMGGYGTTDRPVRCCPPGWRFWQIRGTKGAVEVN
jgi:hypothetical protein